MRLLETEDSLIISAPPHHIPSEFQGQALGTWV